MESNLLTRTPNLPQNPYAMDGWRVVTGLLALLFLIGGLLLFAAADASQEEAAECERTGGSFCWDFSDLFVIVAVWALALAAFFGGATVAPFGRWRRVLVIGGVSLLVLPTIGLKLLVVSPIGFILVAGVVVCFIVLLHTSSRRPPDDCTGDHDGGAP
jgi:hypothetical protein